MQAEGNERNMSVDDLIVSKTDLKGRITYANEFFLKISDFSLDEIIGQPHSIIRSQAMPRCVFKLLWDHLEAGREVFAYVVNKTKTGDHYWVFAHVTPSRDVAGRTISYHSNRRKPEAKAVGEIKKLYDVLLAEEGRHKNGKKGVAAATSLLQSALKERGVDYDEFVLAL